MVSAPERQQWWLPWLVSQTWNRCLALGKGPALAAEDTSGMNWKMGALSVSPSQIKYKENNIIKCTLSFCKHRASGYPSLETGCLAQCFCVSRVRHERRKRIKRLNVCQVTNVGTRKNLSDHLVQFVQISNKESHPPLARLLEQHHWLVSVPGFLLVTHASGWSSQASKVQASMPSLFTCVCRAGQAYRANSGSALGWSCWLFLSTPAWLHTAPASCHHKGITETPTFPFKGTLEAFWALLS